MPLGRWGVGNCNVSGMMTARSIIEFICFVHFAGETSSVFSSAASATHLDILKLLLILHST